MANSDGGVFKFLPEWIVFRLWAVIVVIFVGMPLLFAVFCIVFWIEEQIPVEEIPRIEEHGGVTVYYLESLREAIRNPIIAYLIVVLLYITAIVGLGGARLFKLIEPLALSPFKMMRVWVAILLLLGGILWFTVGIRMYSGIRVVEVHENSVVFRTLLVTQALAAKDIARAEILKSAARNERGFLTTDLHLIIHTDDGRQFQTIQETFYGKADERFIRYSQFLAALKAELTNN